MKTLDKAADETAPEPAVNKHTGWRAGGVLLTLAVLCASFVAVMDLLLESTTTTSDVYKRSLTSLSLELENVSVEIEPGPAGQVRVIRDLEWSTFRPKVRETWEGDTLRIKMDCPIEIVQPCHASYRLSIPEQTPLSVNSGGGYVAARGLTGKVDINLSGGGVRLEGLPGEVDITSVAGDVWIVDAQAKSVRVKADAGDVYLGFATPPANVEARTTAGNLNIQVPRGAPYLVNAESVAGSRDVSVEETAGAPHRIFARNSAGDLSVRYQGGQY
ncbi:DUF4097 family beta strand repeat-containing protein [Actinocorallia populi]|uniref:DUF4097 family beta strand repeat-containing protein n=1 Tax=Actinocorallia populi TaxID=2079200 RepID=UPI000D09412F|nr:DUF4097 family beta strand repeat-containing protein [Actinocorallia populi]